MAFLTQAEFLGSINRVNGSFELVVEGDVEITGVGGVGSDANVTADGFAVVDGDSVVEVENSLLPVSVSGIGTSSENNGSMALGELNVKVSDKSVNVIVSLGDNLKVRGPSQIFNLHSVDIDLHDLRRASHNSVGVDSIDERLQISLSLDARHVESIDVVPVCDANNRVLEGTRMKNRLVIGNQMLIQSLKQQNMKVFGSNKDFRFRTVDLLVLVISIFNSSNVDAGLVGKDDTSGCEPLVASENDRVQHGLIEEEIAHPLAHNDVNLLNGELDLFDLALDALDT